MQRLPIFATLLAVSAVCGAFAAEARADFINLSDAGSYAILFEGNGANTLQITNVTVVGNVGVGRTGLATDSGPSSVTGAINFSAANTGQFSNNNNSNVITGGVHYGVSTVTSALNWVNSLSQTIYNDHGTNLAINGNQTVQASAGQTFTVNGQTVHVFDVTSFANGGGQTLTINGSASDLVAFNMDGIGNIQFHGGIVFTGGLDEDNVLWNVGGGNYSTLTGGSSLDINNNGGDAGVARGIFLDPNGAISAVNAVIHGRLFGGDTHDFQYVSGAEIDAEQPPVVPLPGAAWAGMGLLAALGAVRRMRRRKQAQSID